MSGGAYLVGASLSWSSGHREGKSKEGEDSFGEHVDGCGGSNFSG